MLNCDIQDLVARGKPNLITVVPSDAGAQVAFIYPEGAEVFEKVVVFPHDQILLFSALLAEWTLPDGEWHEVMVQTGARECDVFPLFREAAWSDEEWGAYKEEWCEPLRYTGGFTEEPLFDEGLWTPQ